MSVSNMRGVAQAVESVKNANLRLSNEVRQAFPFGARIEVPRGRGKLRGIVEGHGPHWSRPLEVLVRLDSNGRRVWVDVTPLLPDDAFE